jgi:CO/xanthine dehydrogenase Mo-binding subunit
VKFDVPATTNPIDQLKIVGQPVDRIDGRLKTTGRAPYAYERYDVAPNAAYGYVIGAGIVKGRILSIDSAAARALPGVLAVVTAENAGKLGKGSTLRRRCSAAQRSRTTTDRLGGSRNRSNRLGRRPPSSRSPTIAQRAPLIWLPGKARR